MGSDTKPERSTSGGRKGLVNFNTTSCSSRTHAATPTGMATLLDYKHDRSLPNNWQISYMSYKMWAAVSESVSSRRLAFTLLQLFVMAEVDL
jgi:hypothetical protein